MQKHIPTTMMVQRIENRSGSGLPDVLLTENGKDYWVELKALPSFPSQSIDLFDEDLDFDQENKSVDGSPVNERLWFEGLSINENLIEHPFNSSVIEPEKCKLRPSQKLFATKRIKHGGTSFVLASDRRPRSGVALYQPALVRGKRLILLEVLRSADWGEVFAALRARG